MVQNGDGTGPVTSSHRPIHKDLVLLLLVALVFLADQLTKSLVREFLALRESFPDQGFFRITHTFNTGSAFGLFQDQNIPLILVSVVGITILLLIYRGRRRRPNLFRLSLGLQIGGAAGNVVDRVRLGHVTDFVDVGAWPIFNLADASIVVGLALLAWILLVSDSPVERSTVDSSTFDSPKGNESNEQSPHGPNAAGEEEVSGGNPSRNQTDEISGQPPG